MYGHPAGLEASQPLTYYGIEVFEGAARRCSGPSSPLFPLRVALPLRFSVVGFASSEVGIPPRTPSSRRCPPAAPPPGPTRRLARDAASSAPRRVRVPYQHRISAAPPDRRPSFTRHVSDLPRGWEIVGIEFLENMLGYDIVLELRNEIAE